MKKLTRREVRVRPEPDDGLTTSRPSNRILAGLVAFYILLTLALILSVPINAAPDEAAHFEYVQHLATTEQFPVFEAVGAYDPTGTRPLHYEFHQPPLYYLSCLPLWKLTGPRLQRHMCRVMSLLYGALTLVLLWYAVTALFPDKRLLPIIATGFAALWPLHQGVGASASNDALAGLIASAIFCMIALGSSRGLTKKDLVILGALSGLGLLTKSSCLVLLFVALGATWHFSMRQKDAGQPGKVEPVRSPVFAVAIVLGITLLASGWWLARSQTLYGDPFALGIFNQAFGNDPSAQVATFMRFGHIPLFTYVKAVLFLLFCTAWGIFGGIETARSMINPFTLNVLHPAATQPVLPMFICMAVTAMVCWGLVRSIKNWKLQSPEIRAALLWWTVGLTLVTLGFIAFNTRYYQAQARYFHPALLPMAFAFAVGWKATLYREGSEKLLWIGSGIFGLTLVALALWNVFGWRTLV